MNVTKKALFLFYMKMPLIVSFFLILKTLIGYSLLFTSFSTILRMLPVGGAKLRELYAVVMMLLLTKAVIYCDSDPSLHPRIKHVN